MPTSHYAHTPNDQGHWQPWLDHANAVSEKAEDFAGSFHAAELGKCLGMSHDIDKLPDEFQSYLRKCHEAKKRGDKPPKARVDHKTAGAVWAQRIEGADVLLALLSLGHQAGC